MLRQAARAGGALRRFATATPEPDLVAAAFVSQQVKLRALIAGGKGMAMPVDGDAASISKFKTDYEALRKKVGLQSVEERLNLSLASLREGATDVRSYLGAASKLQADAGIDDAAGAGKEALEALAAVEKSLGKPLLFADAKGMAALKAALAPVQKKLGLADAKVADLTAAAALEDAAITAEAMKRAREEAVATAA